VRAVDDNDEEEDGQSSEPVSRIAYVPETRREKTGQVSKADVVVLRDGIVLLRKAFGIEEQQRWVDMCIEHGTSQVEGVHSFYDGEISQELGYFDPSVAQPSSSTAAAAGAPSGEPSRQVKKLNLVNKARINVPIALHPTQFTAVAQELVRIAHEHCASIPCLDDPNTCRLNYYTNNGKIGWHYDRVPSLSREEQQTVTDPVISMSFGNSAEFQFKQRMDDPAESVILESGDVHTLTPATSSCALT
jgi:alkylated DNA repair dioxygenase AlkB